MNKFLTMLAVLAVVPFAAVFADDAAAPAADATTQTEEKKADAAAN